MVEPRAHTVLHKDGSVRAKGHTLNGLAEGYWEWFRRDGTKLRSGHFDQGAQVGEWTTYNRKGEPHRVTEMKPDEAGATKPLTWL